MDSKHKQKLYQIKKHKEKLLKAEAEISLTAILNSEKFQEIISGCREFRERLYTPLKTLFIFIKQVLSSDKSCRHAVAGVIAEQISQGVEIPASNNTGPYCKARQRLPEPIIKELAKEVSDATTKAADPGWRIYGREAKVVDGTTVLMPDTAENQKMYPQHGNQKEGSGFPLARIVAVMSLTVGTIIDYAVGAYKGKGTGEQTLLRSIWSCIKPQDILLGDRYYPSFFLMADLLAVGADGLFGGQAQRHYDFRKGQQIGKKDHIVDWKRPVKPEWMDDATYSAHPEKIRIREFKVGGAVYVTTFINEEKYPRKELAKFYEIRWQVELNLRSLKSVMNMDMLSCKTPEMVMKEIGVHFLAYNFIRTLMAQACSQHDSNPKQVSFKGTVQLLNQFMPYFINSSEDGNEFMFAELLKLIVKNKIGHRPGRVEPRVVKRRRKPFPLLKGKRIVAKLKLENKRKKLIAKIASS